jgi:hypothetical protein
MSRPHVTCVLAAALCAAGAAAHGPPSVCGTSETERAAVEPFAARAVVSLALAPRRAASEVRAVAIEVIEEGSDRPVVHLRFAAGAHDGPEWLRSTTAVLGTGTGPDLVRMPGETTCWLVFMARREGERARPVAVTACADEEQRRLELDRVELAAADNVFSPRAVAAGDRVLLAWGESHGAEDRVRHVRWPPSSAPATLETGRLGPVVEAATDDATLLLTWTRASGPYALHTQARAALVDAATGGVTGPVTAGGWDEPIDVLGAALDASGVSLHLLGREPGDETVIAATAGRDLGGFETHRTDVSDLPLWGGAGACAAGSHPVLAWTGDGALAAWSGGSAWVVAAEPVEPPVEVVREGEGTAFAWVERSHGAAPRIVVAAVGDGDADGDTVPDGVDLCPDVPEGGPDHDGCPDPPPPASPLGATHAFFPAVAPGGLCAPVTAGAGSGGRFFAGGFFDGSSVLLDSTGPLPVEGLPGPVRDVLPAPAGGWLAVADHDAFFVGDDAVPVRVAIAPDGEPASVHGLLALTGGRVGALTGGGACELGEASSGPTLWLLDDGAVIDGHHDDALGTLLATDGGEIVVLGPAGDVRHVEPPAGAAGDELAGAVAAAGRIFAAWSLAGVYVREGTAGGWRHLPREGDPEVASLVRGPDGQVLASWRDGAVHALSDATWVRQGAGLEGVWVRRLMAAPGSPVLAIGSDGRMRLLTRHRVQARMTVDAAHLGPKEVEVDDALAAELSSVVEELLSGEALVRIEGHTDSSGSRALNLALSSARAASLAAWFASQGVDDRLLHHLGFGEAHPVTGDGGDLLNRRLEVVVLER